MRTKDKLLKIRCKLWRVNGFLEKSLDRDILEVVANKYQNIGLVPKDYLQPEFLLKKKKIN